MRGEIQLDKMHRSLFSLVSVGLAAVLAACTAAPAAAPNQPQPAATPVATASSKLAVAAASPAPAAGGATTVAAGSSATADWDQLVAAAKQEGRVAVVGPTGTEAMEVLTKPFQEKYGISVEFLAGSNRDIVPRIRSERSANQFLWDVRVGGAIVDALPELGAIAPIQPALVLPDVKDPKTWRGGGIEFADREQQVLVMTPFHRGTVFVNPSMVKPEEITSYKDLLDPKWKGKILMDDPRSSGPGQATFTFFYLHPELGPDFIRALGKQEITILKNFQQEVDAVGQGRFPILLGTADFVAEQRKAQGVPITTIDPRQIKEGSDVSPANGELALFSNAPHPNAAKLYINWLLSKEGQTAFARAMGYVSARVDVPTDHQPAWRVPVPGAIKTYTWEQGALKDERLVPLLKEVFGG